MRITWIRSGLVVATLNLLVFIAMLLVRETAYSWLSELDACFRSGSSCDWSSAEPMYLAGRPFDSPVHVAGVPFAETLYFNANFPAMLAAMIVGSPLLSWDIASSSDGYHWRVNRGCLPVTSCCSPVYGRF